MVVLVGFTHRANIKKPMPITRLTISNSVIFFSSFIYKEYKLISLSLRIVGSIAIAKIIFA